MISILKKMPFYWYFSIVYLKYEKKKKEKELTSVENPYKWLCHEDWIYILFCIKYTFQDSSVPYQNTAHRVICEDWTAQRVICEDWPAHRIICEDWSAHRVIDEDWPAHRVIYEDWPTYWVICEDWPAHRVICEDWHFAHMWKTLISQHHLLQILQIWAHKTSLTPPLFSLYRLTRKWVVMNVYICY
jgi:hypothetical protein